jgi:hypothetical protein
MWRWTELAATSFGISLGILAPAVFSPAAEADTIESKQIDDLVAPVALYPDPLLAKVLIASTYPLELKEAATGPEQHGSAQDLGGRKPKQQHWDDSVESIARIPRLLVMMNDHLDWAQKLGDMFLSRPDAVLDSVQSLRAKATSIGFLRSNDFQKAIHTPQGIEIEPVRRELLYLPYYDQYTLNSPSEASTRPQPSWVPPPGHSYERQIRFLPGIAVPPTLWNAAISWSKHRIYLSPPKESENPGNSVTALDGVPWQHDPVHRRGVNYSTPELRARYSNQSIASADTRPKFRGYSGGAAQMQISAGSNNEGALRDTSHFSKHGGALDGVGEGLQTAVFSQRGRRSLGYAVGSAKPKPAGVFHP